MMIAARCSEEIAGMICNPLFRVAGWVSRAIADFPPTPARLLRPPSRAHPDTFTALYTLFIFVKRAKRLTTDAIDLSQKHIPVPGGKYGRQ
jgi:hypothetical protein